VIDITLGSIDMVGDYEFDQAEYWRSRHKDFQGDPRSVGNMSLSKEENEVAETNLKRFTRDIFGTLGVPLSVIDVGCGYGRLTKSFVENGFGYTGLDISPLAVERARLENALGDFEVAELSSWQGKSQYGLVFAGWVFVHFVDDDKWYDFLTKCLSWVLPGGALLFAEWIPEHRQQNVIHVLARPLREFQAVFDACGFTIDQEWRKAMMERTKHYRSPSSHFFLVRKD
jgi:2-polyprenyl-3-methyl-5-hydroxy-6-metoxy-1,4-benzoquinol methylase